MGVQGIDASYSKSKSVLWLKLLLPSSSSPGRKKHKLEKIEDLTEGLQKEKKVAWPLLFFVILFSVHLCTLPLPLNLYLFPPKISLCLCYLYKDQPFWASFKFHLRTFTFKSCVVYFTSVSISMQYARTGVSFSLCWPVFVPSYLDFVRNFKLLLPYLGKSAFFLYVSISCC